MRILIDPSAYQMTNLGDIAMTQVTVRRLLRLWPDAWIGVLTDRRDLSGGYCPGSHAIPVDGLLRWFRKGVSVFVGSPVYQLIPGRVSGPLGRLEASVRQRWPSFAYRGVQLWQRLWRLDTWSVSAFADAVRTADLVVLSGGGYFTSVFEDKALRALELLQLARHWGVRTAMFGQGLGPIHTSELMSYAKAVFPSVDLIALRERRRGVALLDKMGVDPKRVWITGDDAVETAFNERTLTAGQWIGVNLRYAPYSQVEDDAFDAVRRVLHTLARRHGASLVPVPVALGGLDSDVPTIRRLLERHPIEERGWEAIASPEQLIRRIGQCRVVVTGSYHGAVFALSQGIPAVGLVRSEYSLHKFQGLADEFGHGCETVDLQAPRLRERLIDAIERAWATADANRPALVSSAVRQIEASRSAYQHLIELMGSGGSYRAEASYGQPLTSGASNARPAPELGVDNTESRVEV